MIHVIYDRIINHGPLLAQVGQMNPPHATGGGDGARHAGSPHRGDDGWKSSPRDSYWPPHSTGMDPEDVVQVKSRTFNELMSRHQRIIINPLLHILRAAVARSGKVKVDTIEVRLALRCLLTHCPGRWPLDLFWSSVATDHDIGRSRGCTAAFNEIPWQLHPVTCN